MVNPVKHPDLVIRELCQDEVGFWVAKKPTEAQNPNSDKSTLICDPNLQQTQKLLMDLAKKKIHFKRKIYSSNLEVITDLTMEGAGVGILPRRVATRHKSFGLQPIKGSYPTFKDRVCLVYRSDAQKTRARNVILKSIQIK